MKSNPEYEHFSGAMNTILRADPAAVKAAMEAEKRERKMEAERTGKRGRGRPPKHSAASGPASSETG
jgi:AT-hook transcription factor